MECTTFSEILELITALIKKRDKVMREAIMPKQRRFSTLRFLACGLSFEDLKFVTAIANKALEKSSFKALIKVLKENIKVSS